MAADVVTRRIIELDVKTSGEALRALKQQQESLKQMEKSIQSAKDAVAGFAKGFVAAFSVAAVVGGIKSTIDAMDQLNDRAQQMGVSVQTLTEWGYAAQMSGASSEELDAGIRGLSKSMADMTNKTAASTKALSEFGVKASDDVDTALTKIAEGFSKLPDGPQKSALAMDLFGKAGTKLIPLLNEGAEGVANLKKEAHDLGIVLMDQDVAAAAAFNDQLDQLQMRTNAMGQQFVNGLLPALSTLVGAFSDAVGGANGFKAAGEILGGTLINLAKMFIGVKATIIGAAQALGGLFAAVDLFSRKEFRAAGQAIKLVAEDIRTAVAEAQKEMDALDKRYLDTQTKFETQQSTPKPAATGTVPTKTTTQKKERDEALEYLKKFTESAKAAAAGVKELSASEQLEYEIASKNLTIRTAQQKKALELAQAAATLKDVTELQRKAEEQANAEAEKTRQRQADRISNLVATRQSILDLVDPASVIVRKMEEVEEILSITFDESQRAMLEEYIKTLRQDFTVSQTLAKNSIGETKDALAQLGETLKNEIEGYSKDAANAIVDFALTGKASFKDMINSIIADMARLAVKRALDPLFQNIGTLVQGYFSGGTTPVVPKANGGAFIGGVEKFASGGVVSSPTFFGMAGGAVGLMGEAGPEAVVPLKRTASGQLGVQASPVNVTVINTSGADVKTEESRSASGEQQIRILVNKAVEEGIGRGRFDRVMSNSYGVTRKGR